MSATKKAQQAVIDAKIPATIRVAIETVAKGLGVAAIELWSIFVRQYVVKGAVNLFFGVIFVAAGAFMWHLIGYWALIPVIVGLPFFYVSIILLLNPKYYAIEEITDKINELR